MMNVYMLKTCTAYRYNNQPYNFLMGPSTRCLFINLDMSTLYKRNAHDLLTILKLFISYIGIGMMI